MIMMFNCFNLDTLLRCVFCLQVLSGLCLSQVHPSDDFRKVCIKTATSSSVNKTCVHQNRIQVVSIYYGYDHTFGKACEIPTENKLCSKLIKKGHELKTRGLFICSEFTQECREEVGQLRYSQCKDGNSVVVKMEYRCVDGADIIDFCDDNVTLTPTRIKHLIYPTNDTKTNRSKTCTCSIKGNHALTAVRADDKNTVEIQCRKAIETSPGTSCLVSSTTRQTEEGTASTAGPPTQSTLEAKTRVSKATAMTETSTSPNTANIYGNDSLPLTERNMKVPVIVGSVIGGLVLIIILTVIGVLVYRRKRREKSPSGLDSFDGAVDNTHTYDEIDARNHQTYTNNACEEGTPDYSSVGNTDVIIGNENDITPAVSSTDYDLLKPSTIFHTVPYQNKKAIGEQHNEVPLYDHTKTQTKSANDPQGNNINASDYDVLESKANLKSSFDNVEISEDDTYNHIGDRHKEPSNNPGQRMLNAAKSAPVHKPRAEQKYNNSVEGADNTAKLDSTGNANDTNIYHILEEPTTQEIQAGIGNEDPGPNNDPKT